MERDRAAGEMGQHRALERCQRHRLLPRPCGRPGRGRLRPPNPGDHHMSASCRPPIGPPRRDRAGPGHSRSRRRQNPPGPSLRQPRDLRTTHGYRPNAPKLCRARQRADRLSLRDVPSRLQSRTCWSPPIRPDCDGSYDRDVRRSPTRASHHASRSATPIGTARTQTPIGHGKYCKIILNSSRCAMQHSCADLRRRQTQRLRSPAKFGNQGLVLGRKAPDPSTTSHGRLPGGQAR